MGAADCRSFVEVSGCEVLELWGCRHGETDCNVARVTQGHSGSKLNANGWSQSVALGVRLANLGFTQVLVSDLARTVQTAEIAGLCDYALEPPLREKGAGKLEGQPRGSFSAAARACGGFFVACSTRSEGALCLTREPTRYSVHLAARVLRSRGGHYTGRFSSPTTASSRSSGRHGHRSSPKCAQRTPGAASGNSANAGTVRPSAGFASAAKSSCKPSATAEEAAVTWQTGMIGDFPS